MRKVVIALVFACVAGMAFGQCYTRSPYLSDACDTSASGDAYEYYAPHGFGFVAPSTLLLNIENDMVVFDVSNPLSPKKLLTVHIPWDWTTVQGDSTHGPLIAHISTIATLDGFPYALVGLGTYGWDLLSVNGSATKFLGHGYHPASNMDTDPIGTVALVRAGGAVYFVGQNLDGNPKTALRMYAVPNPDTVTAATLGPGVALPGTSGRYNTLRVFSRGGSTYLAAYSIPQVTTTFWDVTVPTAPVKVGTSAAIKGNAFTVDANAVVWAPDWATAVLHGYTFTPNAPDPLSPVYAVASVKPPAYVSTAGALIVTWTSSWGGMVYASLTGNAVPSAGVPYNALDPGRSGNPSTCKNNSFGEKFYSAAAFVVGGHAYVARALYVDADIVAVSDSCLSGLPTPTPSPVLPTATPTLPGPQPTATPTSPCPPCPCLTPTPRPTPTPQPTTPPAGLYCHFSNGTCKPIEELPGGMTCPGILNSVPCP